MRSHVKASPVESTLSMGARRPAFARAISLALTLAAFALLAFAPLSQARVVVGGFGTPGTEGGQFDTPRGVAVNNSGVGVPEGTIYVVDSQNRVQRFSPSGSFERLWGFDVVEGGSTGFEICTVASECEAGVEFPTTANGGQLGNPRGIAVDQTDGHIYVTEQANHRVSEFDADGNFIRTWGKDVVTGGATGFEICTGASECKQGELGGLGGEFGASLGYPTVDAVGNVFIADTSNSRIQQFDTSGNFIRLAGGDVVTNGATGTGTLETTSTTVTNLLTTSKYFEVGQMVTSSGGSLPPGTTITAVSPTTLTLSDFPTANGSETITAAPGVENVPNNEIQTVSIGSSTFANAFNLSFESQSTGASGTADMGIGTNVLKNVNTNSGEFAVGQYITGSKIAQSTKIIAIDSIAHTITLSKPNPDQGGAGGMAITAFAIPGEAPASVVQAALEGLSSFEPGDVSVSGPAGGPWAVTFLGSRYGGADVPQLSSAAMFGSSPPITSVNGLEVCTVAAECRSGASGTGLGQFGGTGATRVAVDALGNVFATDDDRLQKFSPSLESVAVFGAAALANFTTTSPENLASVAGGSRIAVSVRGNVVNGPASEGREIIELDAADGSLEDTSLVGVGLTSINGLTERAATATLYITTDAGVSPRSVLALDTPIALPVPVMNPVTTKDATTATFTGMVDPMGGIGVTCKFEYSQDQVNWTAAPEPECPSLATGGGAQSVSESVSELAANSKYFVRLSVARTFDPTSTKVSVVQSFSTDHIAPIATNLGAAQITNTSMRLVARINPMHSTTGYVFEYGSTPALGSSTSAVHIGDGSESRIVSRVIQGLNPETTYYFRLVASNLAGSTTTARDSARTRTTPLPSPDNRVYEMVSPVEKNGGGALSGRGGATVALDGQAVQFDTSSLFGDPPGVQPFITASYVSRRTSKGWQTRATLPAGCRTDLDDEVGVPFLLLESMYSPNLDKFVFGNMESVACPTPPLDPSAPLPSANLYLTDLTAQPSSYTLIAPKPSPVLQTYATDSGILAGYSDDFSHIVYESGAQQTPDAPPVQLETSDRAVPSVYEWDDNAKELRLVSKDPSGNAITTGAISVSTGGFLGNLSGSLGAIFPAPRGESVSDDGSRIFFTSPATEFGGCLAECQLYMREHATTTHQISESECTLDCGPNLPNLYRASSADGRKVLMLTRSKLTNSDTADAEAGPDLFFYNHSANPTTDSNLTLVTQDLELADGVGSGNPPTNSPAPAGVAAGSADLETIYFLSLGQLVSGEPTGPGLKLYRWRWNDGSPKTEYLATLPQFGTSEQSQRNPNRFSTTPDGENVLLETTAQLSPAADQDSTIDLYRWDQANDWRCVTCQETGVSSEGDVAAPQRAMTNDGERVFFTTRESLVPDDLNEGKRDAYEWREGTISLISSGTDQDDVTLLGASASGEDVFFYTEERLVGWDIDQAGDIYDARIGGGFPEPPPTGASCEGEACRGAASTATAATGAGTAAFEGPGDTRAASRCRKGTRKVTVRGRTVCKKPRKRRSGKRNAQRRSQAGANRGASR